MFAYVSLNRGGPAAGVLWGNARHHNGTCAHKVITYHPRRAQKPCGSWTLSCSGTAARSGVGILRGVSRLGRINGRITLSPSQYNNCQRYAFLLTPASPAWRQWTDLAAAGWTADIKLNTCGPNMHSCSVPGLNYPLCKPCTWLASLRNDANSEMEPLGVGEREVPPEPSDLLLLKCPQKSFCGRGCFLELCNVWMNPLRALIRPCA